ncbi:hypothetical protein D3C81_2012900 [compost metagenome]
MVHYFFYDGFVGDRPAFQDEVVPGSVEGHCHFAAIRIPVPHQVDDLLNSGALSGRPSAAIRLPMLPGLGKSAVSMTNRFTLDAFIPLAVLQLAFDLGHQLAIMGAGHVT